MILEIDGVKREELRDRADERQKKELDSYRVNNRKNTIRLAIHITLFLLIIYLLIIGIHYLRAGALPVEYIKRHGIRILIAEIAFVLFPAIVDIASSSKTESMLAELVSEFPDDDVTFEVTDDALIELKSSEVFNTRLLKDISDINKDGDSVTFTYLSRAITVPDYFTPSLYETLSEAKERYKEMPERDPNKIVMPKKLSRKDKE